MAPARNSYNDAWSEPLTRTGYEIHDHEEFLAVPKAPRREEISLDEALKRVGGFGRFQCLAVMVFAIIRNVGQLPIYTFSINSEIPELVCRHSPTETFQICSTDYVCSHRSNPIPDFEWSPNWNKPGIVKNWVLSNDWICDGQNTIMTTVSFYFMGFALGIFLFFIPDRYGRKKAMLMITGPFIAQSIVLTYFPQRELKAIAFGINGFLHIKVSLAYTHSQEFLCKSHRSISPTVITMFDSGSILIFAVYLLFVNNETHYIQTYFFWLGIVAYVIYIIWIPESPVYLFLKDPRSKEGIRILNYIAKFNGSSYRFDEDKVKIRADM
jgi:hypothetical protein